MKDSDLSRFIQVWGSLLLVLTLWQSSADAQTARSLSLSEVLATAMEHSALLDSGLDLDNSEPPYHASAWLAGLPTFSARYLDSDERLGTTETELSLNLPVRSARQREYNRTLASMVGELDRLADDQRSVFLSGLIRESVWSHRLAITRAEYAGRKARILQKLAARQEQLHAANVISAYSLLVIKKERLLAELNQRNHEQESRRWLQQYRQVTGLSTIPEHLLEADPGEHFRPAEHPDLQSLASRWSQRQQLLLAAGARSAPWNVSVTAKKLEIAEFEETQYGVGVEIPLSFLNLAQQTNNSEWAQGARDFRRAADRLASQLMRRWDGLAVEALMLAERQQLLADADKLSRDIAAQARELRTSNELEEEIVLRRIIESSDSEEAVAINQLLIGQNTAMRRQAAGLSL